jgi:hypothetical protein
MHGYGKPSNVGEPPPRLIVAQDPSESLCDSAGAGIRGCRVGVNVGEVTVAVGNAAAVAENTKRRTTG